MERKIYIPEVWVIFWAAGHVAQRNVRFFQLKQLEKLLENTVKNEFRYKIIFTPYERVDNVKFFFKTENSVFIPIRNTCYEDLFYQYKDKIIKTIATTVGIDYFNAAGIVEYVKLQWKKNLKEI